MCLFTLEKQQNILFRPNSVYPLALFRIVFGSILILQFFKFRTAFLQDYVHRSYFIHYDLFEWVQLPPADWLSVLFVLWIVAAVLVTVGLFYRVAMGVVFTGLTYLFLSEQSIYNNHYYLFCLLSFLMIFTRADGALSIRSWRGGTVSIIPNWQLLLIRGQIFILYFFGGVAKLNADWLLRAQPVKTWLPEMFGDHYSSLSAMAIEGWAFFFAYSGLVIDLSVGFLLFHRRLKWLAFAILIPFHISNAFMFSIGYFPLFGVLSLVVFLSVEDIQAVWKRLKPADEQKVTSTASTAFTRKPLVTALFTIWFVLQVLIPLRHWMMPGPVQWNMNGYLFAWFMKLNDVAPINRFEVELPGSAQRYTFEMEELTESPSQRHHVSTHPFGAVNFAHDVEAYLKQKNQITGDIKVFCDSYVSLNGREFQRKIDPTVDLTALSLPAVGKYFTGHKWIIPLGNDTLVDRTVVYRIKQLEQQP